MVAAALGRDGRIDTARGLAVIAMVIYHFTWDLAAFGFIDPATAMAPAFRRLGAAIASVFLLISGVALVRARASATDDAAFRARFLRRLAILVVAGALVSLGTYLAMGDRFVRFGILHCLAAASLLALPFLRRPFWMAAAAGVTMLVVPWVVASPALNHPLLLGLGLSTALPNMVDYVPVFPFAGVAFLGVAYGQVMGGSAGVPPTPWLGWLGRHSLPIYLLHQPLLYGGLFLLASLTATAQRVSDGAVPDRDTTAFRSECRKACEGQGNDKAHCDRYCTCAETDMKATGLWTRVMASPDTTGIQPQLAPLLQACFAKAQTPP